MNTLETAENSVVRMPGLGWCFYSVNAEGDHLKHAGFIDINICAFSEKLVFEKWGLTV